MKIQFKKIIIHHFLSIEHVEINLKDKGYCLVKGINKNPKDASKSNGAGKSTIFNAVSFALVGETLQGLKSNLSNLYFNDGCYVQLELDIDSHNYIIFRSKDDKKYGTDLKITVDNVDKSGKTLTESKTILEQLLPDLTSELIGSVIMIGQGMPMKFTANTPSGRKEVLEHLSQSDFMIQDLKDRITTRQIELSKQIRTVEDHLLENTTQESIFTKQLEDATQEYSLKYEVEPNFKVQLEELENKKKTLENSILTVKTNVEKLNESYNTTNSSLMTILTEKEKTVNKFSEEHQQALEEFNNIKTDLSTKKLSLEQEIYKLKSIKDVCPTCGQKIPGVIKKDTSEQEKQVQQYLESLDKLNKEIEEDRLAYSEVLKKIDCKFDNKIQELKTLTETLQSDIRKNNSKQNEEEDNLRSLVSQLATVTKNKEFFEENKSKLLKNINQLKDNLDNLSNSKKKLTLDKESLDEHNAVISKMNTIVKRDFRGFLLKSIIEYIDAKAKDYASKIFNCNEMSFTLEGNNIEISFCNKDYENLSGGEKQRVDLITQFAIREFLCDYLQFSSNILVLDEITDALDSESCDKVINFITTELKDIESIFIISHHADELSLPVDSEIIIEKNELGVSNVIY